MFPGCLKKLVLASQPQMAETSVFTTANTRLEHVSRFIGTAAVVFQTETCLDHDLSRRGPLVVQLMYLTWYTCCRNGCVYTQSQHLSMKGDYPLVLVVRFPGTFSVLHILPRLTIHHDLYIAACLYC